MRKKFEVLGPAHVGRSHIGPNYVEPYGIVLGNDDGPRDTLFYKGNMAAFFPVKRKASFLKDTFKPFPVNWA